MVCLFFFTKLFIIVSINELYATLSSIPAVQKSCQSLELPPACWHGYMRTVGHAGCGLKFEVDVLFGS